MYERRKQILKIGAVALVTIGLCGWVVYRLLYPDTTVQYNDFVIDSAVKWLENADDGDFGECREDIVDKDGWFDWFVKDRKSLKDLKQRNLLSRSALSGAPAGMKRYELKFDSKFSVIKYPKAKVIEKLLVESDGEKQFKVLMADYWLKRAFEPSDITVSENDKQQIMAVAEKILKKIEARDIGFFKRAYTEIAQQPDYFGWNKYYIRAAKNPKGTIKLFETLSRGTSLEFTELKTYVLAGHSGFECSSVRYHFSVENEGKKENFRLQIFVDRDLYQNKSAKWKFYGLGWWKERKKMEKK